MKPITIISGPVGAGKSAVAKELTNMAQGAVALIEGDVFWTFFAKVDARPQEKNFVLVMRAMMSTAVNFAVAKYDTILDFSIPPWFLPTALKVAQFKEVELDFVVLKPSIDVCAARAASRAEGTITDYSYYKELYDSFNDLPQYVIEDSVSDPATIASRIAAELPSGKFRVK